MVEGIDIRAAVARDLEEARERVRDMEGFLRIYDSFSAAHAMPEPRQEDRDERSREVEPLSTTRPAVSLADDDLSLLDAAEKVLRYHRRAMKAGDLAHRMLLWGFPYDKGVDALRASVGGVLARAVREGMGPFTKASTGVFGLREWGEQANQQEAKQERTDQNGGDSLFTDDDREEAA